MQSDQLRRAAVAGGAGFLGSHLCRLLVREGFHVVCVDDLSTGRRENVADLLAADAVTFVEHDITEPIRLDCEWIFNLACPASPVHYQADPIQTTKTSMLGALNLLEEAQRSGARILQASTSEIYGDPTVHPQVESYWGNVNPIGPRSCYDEGKRVAETLFFDYHRTRNVDARVVRIFNTYGPAMRADDGRVVSNFIVQALAGSDITVYGDGQQTRSFCFVSDLIEVIYRVMNLSGNKPFPYNIGNPVEFTVLELAQKVIELTASTSRIIRQPLPIDDPKQRRPNIAAVEAATGWTPQVGLDQGLLQTIRYFSGQWDATAVGKIGEA